MKFTIQVEPDCYLVIDDCVEPCAIHTSGEEHLGKVIWFDRIVDRSESGYIRSDCVDLVYFTNEVVFLIEGYYDN